MLGAKTVRRLRLTSSNRSDRQQGLVSSRAILRTLSSTPRKRHVAARLVKAGLKAVELCWHSTLHEGELLISDEISEEMGRQRNKLKQVS